MSAENVYINKLDPEALRILAGNVKTAVEAIQEAANNINTQMQKTVPAVWSGDAATNFESNWQMDYKEYATKVSNLETLVDTIKAIAAESEARETELATAAKYHVAGV